MQELEQLLLLLLLRVVQLLLYCCAVGCYCCCGAVALLENHSKLWLRMVLYNGYKRAININSFEFDRE